MNEIRVKPCSSVVRFSSAFWRASVLDRAGQRIQIAPGKDLLKFVNELAVDAAIRSADLTAGNLERSAVEVADYPAGFAHQQNAGCRVPGIKIEFPKAVETSASDAGQIERG